jgi:3-hydroxyisobutyrate dehydrogenase-like beta-hydroxyacid dehydrogenase
MARVGFIGLGNMGGGMAANLAKKGHDVRAFDLSAEALERAKDAGCLPAASAAEAADGAEAIISMLPAGKHVEQVYTESLFGAAPLSAILIDCSTIDVATAKRVAEAALAKGLTAVDAPVSGGIGAANAGTLTFMVGGSAEGFDRAEPFLSDMGVGPDTPADHEYQGGFATMLMLKDLRLAMEAAADAGADTPMGARAAELYEKFAEEGQGSLDFSAIIKMLG